MTFTTDEIIAIAKEASICHSADSYEFTRDGMLGFAALVAAKERSACEALCQRRADVCEAHSEVIRKAQGFTQVWEWVRATARASLRCAAAIRARGTKEGV